MSIFVSGSLAYDFIMNFPDDFENHILEDKIHKINVSFTIDELEKNLGGTAGNIAYNISLLNKKPEIFAPIGKNNKKYFDWLEQNDISKDYIHVSDKYTASAHITTDKKDNQITAFHPGALNDASNLSTKDIEGDIDLFINSPNDAEAMLKYNKELSEKSTEVVFDPGQQITTFNKQQLLQALESSDILVGNDYEISLIKDKTNLSKQEINNKVNLLITTLGEKGSMIENDDQTTEVESAKVQQVLDPTGAGDAYRAGFFVGYQAELGLKKCAQLGSTLASFAIENYGTQNHSPELNDIKNRYKSSYSEELVLN